VSAKDLGTGTEQKIEIKAGSGLSEQDIEQMVKDAESHAAEDKRLRELAEARNNGDNAAYQAEKQLGELGDKVDADSRQRIETTVKELREALAGEDVEAIRSKTEALQQAFHAVSEAMYQQAAGQSGDGAAANGGADDQEEVVDAEVVDEGKS
jgi:molecular chaperone DnaK